MVTIKAKIISITISIILLLSALAGGITAIVLNEINKSNAYRGTESSVSIGNLLTDDGTSMNVDTFNTLMMHLDAIGSVSSVQNSNDINGGNPLIFQMGEVNGNPIYWQVVYRTKDYITVWMTEPYTAEYFNNSGSSINNSDLAGYTTGKYSNYGNYSQSVIRDVTLGIYNEMLSSFSALSSFIVSPQTMATNTGIDWQSTQERKKVSSYYSTTDGLGNQTNDNANNPHGWTYNSCMSDMFWIPSYIEVHYNSTAYDSESWPGDTGGRGLWALPNEEKGFDNSSTALDGTSGVSSYCWLRSGNSTSYSYAMLVDPSGTAGSLIVSSSRGVRPAAHISLSALKNLVKYNVTTAVTPAGSGTASANYSSVALGTSVTFTATETNSSYRFVGWDTNGDGQADNTANPLRVTINADTIYTAIFELRTYSVTTSTDGNGSITASTTVTHGGSYEVTATPVNETYEFDYFILNGNTGNHIRSNPYTIANIIANTTITAYFKLKPYNVSITTNDSSIGNVLYNNSLTNTSNTSISTNQTHGSNLTNIYAIASGGNAFAYWQIDRGGGNVTTSTANPLTLQNITADTTVTAYFSSNVLDTVGVVATYGGSVEILGENFDSLLPSDEITLVSRVKIDGYRFVGWYDGETLLGTSASIKLQYSQIQGKLITARFEPINTNANGQTDTGNSGVL